MSIPTNHSDTDNTFWKAATMQSSNAVIFIDAEQTITQANPSALTFIETLRGELSAQPDATNGDGLVGTNASAVSPDLPGMLDTVPLSGQPVGQRLHIAGHKLDSRICRIAGEGGVTSGWVLEWHEEKSDDANISGDVSRVIDAARKGDYSMRLGVRSQSQSGTLAANINEMLDTVSAGLSEFEHMMANMAEGDLSSRIDGRHEGSFGALKDDANKMADQFSAIIGRISSVSQSVQNSMNEISRGMVDLSQRTDQQASSLEQTSASMEELSTTVQQNAENAQEASKTAMKARESAEKGGEIATEAIAAMDRIEAAARQINEIIEVIQDIAFQTNLLALNASVEAARAGEAGRGFAVVANEVRSLAQSSANASKNIKELINNSENEIHGGAELVKNAGGSLSEIVASVKSVADLVSDIALASQEQSTGIGQVSEAILNMDEMTQQNSALVEETTSVIQSTAEKVDDLHAAMDFFSVNDNGQATQGDKDAGSAVAGEDEKAFSAALSGNGAKMQQRMIIRSVGATAVDAIDPEWKEF